MKTTTSRNNADLHQQLAWMQIENAQLAADRTKRIGDIIDATYAAMTSYYGQRAEIQSDQDLSQSGQRSRLQAAGQRVMGQIDGLAKPALSELDGEIKRLNLSLSRAADGAADDASRTLLKIEARALALAVDPLLREVKYLELCENGLDNLSCEAIEQASAWSPILPDDVLEKGRIMRASALHPDQAETLRQAREARQILGASVDQVRATLGLPFLTAADVGAIVDDVDANGIGDNNVPA